MYETRSSLIHRVRDLSGTESWQEFDALYRPLIRRYVLRQGLAVHAVEDVVQEVFRRLTRSLPNFELDHNRGRFRAWLCGLAHNAIIDDFRRRQREANTTADGPNGSNGWNGSQTTQTPSGTRTTASGFWSMCSRNCARGYNRRPGPASRNM